MKKASLIVIFLSLLLSAGCASRDYVRQQVEPLVDRISKLEAQNCCEKAEEAAKKCEKIFNLQQVK